MTDPIYPDFLGTVNKGYQTGQNMLATRLEGQAINGQGQDRQNALSSLAGVNPQASMALSSGFQQQQQAQEVDHAKKLNGAANYILQAVKTNNPQQIQGAWQNVKPYLEQLTGKTAPDQFDPAMLPAIYQAAGQSGGMPQIDGTVIAPGGVLVDKATGNKLFSNPANMQFQGAVPTGATDANGNPVMQAGGYNPQTGQFQAVQPASGMPQGGAMQGLPAETQAYVPKVMGALGGAQPFDANGQPSPQLLDAIQQTESGGNPNAVSPKGAQGAYQLMPATAASVGVTNPMDPAQSRAGAATYLAQLYQQFGGNAQQAIAAYNAGPGRVSQSLGGNQPQPQPVGAPPPVQPGDLPTATVTPDAYQMGAQASPQASGALGFGQSVKKPTGDAASFHTASADEIAAAGLPKGTSAQINNQTQQIHVLNKGEGGEGLSDDAANLLATAAQQGFKVPIPSLGMKSNGDRDKYLNKLADNIKSTGADIPTAIRNMVYGETGIFATKAMQKNYGVTMQNEMSAQNQAQIALDASNKMQRTDIQALNNWWNTGQKQFGSVDAQNYANAINTFAEEYAKVMSGSNGSAAATDSSRAKAHEMINTGLSNGQMQGVVALMKQEMRGRTQGQLDAIQSQVKGLRDFGDDGNGGDGTPDAQAQSSVQPTQAAQPRAVNSMGHAVVWNGSAWVPE